MINEEIKKSKAKFSTHKAGAKSRNIPFNFTFDEWYSFWLQSGYWHNRGNKKGQYVMSRYNDVGPYEIGNVFIQTAEDNHSQVLITDDRRKKQSKLRKGKKDPSHILEMKKNRMLGNEHWKKLTRNDHGQYQKVEV